MSTKNSVGVQLRKRDWWLDMAGQKKINQLDGPLCGGVPFRELAFAIH